MIKIAVIGHGFLGKWHAQKVHQNKDVEFLAIVESNHKIHGELQEIYPNVKILNDVKDLIKLKPDGVIISTPTSSHFELAKFFLENKVHVFCEKPLCSTVSEAQELSNYLKDDLILQVGHSERFHPIWDTFKQDLKKTTPPYVIKTVRSAPFKGRATDVDVVQDLMIHDLDLIRFIFPKLNTINIKAIGFNQRTNFSDHVQTQLDFDDHSTAYLEVSRNYVFEQRSFEVISKEGAFYVDLLNGNYFKALGEEKNPDNYVTQQKYQKADHLALEQAAFFATITGSGVNPVDYQEGLAAVKLVESVRERI